MRASNCLEASKITAIRQLVGLGEAELLRLRSFGKTSLHEVQRKLAEVGLSLGSQVDESELAEESSADEAPAPHPPDTSEEPSVPAETGTVEAVTTEE